MTKTAISKEFSTAYKTKPKYPGSLAETNELLEIELQAMWKQAVITKTLATSEGHALRVLAPGWWNKLSGPDFTNAQLEFNGSACTGDVEIHLHPRDWYDHGHHRDPAYNQVLLHVVRSSSEKARPAVTQSGRVVATLVWQDGYGHDPCAQHAEPPEHCGECAASLNAHNPEAFRRFLGLAGEWRILEKARRIRERMNRAGPDQAVYEALMGACGYTNFKEQFLRIAQTLPYDRARQLAQQEPFALEAALFRIAGLLPEPWPHESAPPEHYKRIARLREEYLPGLGVLDLAWSRSGSRPANTPERRLAGATRLLIRTADRGLHRHLDICFRTLMKPIERRQALEEFFGGSTGFWADHYAWNGKQAARNGAPLGAGRIRAIIGNVFIPAALAWARLRKDRVLEENTHALFQTLPKEPDNRVHRAMSDWIGAPARLMFQHQQGLLQIHEDWCAHNPSCRNCTLLGFLRTLERNDQER